MGQSSSLCPGSVLLAYVPMESNYLQGAKLKHRAVLYVWEEREKQTMFFNPFVVDGKHRKII